MGSLKTLFTLFLAGLAFFYLMNAYDLTYTGSVIQEANINTRVLLQDQETLKKDYNAHLQNVPNFLKTLFKDAKINLEIEMQDSTIVKRQITTRAAKITTVQEGSHAKADYHIWTTEKTLDKILTAEKSADEFAHALDNKELTIKANTTYGSTKVFLGKIMIKVYALF